MGKVLEGFRVGALWVVFPLAAVIPVYQTPLLTRFSFAIDSTTLHIFLYLLAFFFFFRVPCFDFWNPSESVTEKTCVF